jgi:hypothetical protein
MLTRFDNPRFRKPQPFRDKRGFIVMPGILCQGGGIAFDPWAEDTANGWTSFTASGSDGFTGTSDGSSVTIVPQDYSADLADSYVQFEFTVDQIDGGVLEFSLDNSGTVGQSDGQSGSIEKITGGAKSGSSAIFTSTGSKVVLIKGGNNDGNNIRPKFKYNSSGDTVIISGFVGLPTDYTAGEYLDSYASALPEHIYSMRYVTLAAAAAAGAVIRVQRSSDSTEADFTPAEIADGTMLAWVGTGGTDNGRIMDWYDQGSGASNFTTATFSRGARIVNAGVQVLTTNGNPACSGSQAANDCYMGAGSQTIGANYTAMFASETNDVISVTPAFGAWLHVNEGSLSVGRNGCELQYNAGGTKAGRFMFGKSFQRITTVIRNGTTGYGWSNNVAISTQAGLTATTGAATMILGGRGNGNLGSENSNEAWSEILVWKTTDRESAGDRSAIDQYMQRAWTDTAIRTWVTYGTIWDACAGYNWSSYSTNNAYSTGFSSAQSDGSSRICVPEDLKSQVANQTIRVTFNVQTLTAGTLVFNMEEEADFNGDGTVLGTMSNESGGTLNGNTLEITAIGDCSVDIAIGSVTDNAYPKFTLNTAAATVTVQYFKMEVL